jgi:hypothetical protein
MDALLVFSKLRCLKLSDFAQSTVQLSGTNLFENRPFKCRYPIKRTGIHHSVDHRSPSGCDFPRNRLLLIKKVDKDKKSFKGFFDKLYCLSFFNCRILQVHAGYYKYNTCDWLWNVCIVNWTTMELVNMYSLKGSKQRLGTFLFSQVCSFKRRFYKTFFFILQNFLGGLMPFISQCKSHKQCTLCKSIFTTALQCFRKNLTPWRDSNQFQRPVL